MGLPSLSLRIAFLLVDTFVVMVFFIHFSYTLFFLFFRLNTCLAGLFLLALPPLRITLPGRKRDGKRRKKNWGEKKKLERRGNDFEAASFDLF